MATLSNNGGFGNVFEEDILTNKGHKPAPPAPKPQMKKCQRCDNTVTNEEVCSQCFQLTESALPILLD